MNRLLPLALAFVAAVPISAHAQQIPAPKIVVVGEGESSIAPDLALLSLTVMREAKTAGEALDASSAAMKQVIAAVKETGVEARDIQTGGLQIIPRYTYTSKPDGSQEAQLVGYQASNTLSVRVRDLQKTGEIIDTAVSLGVNQSSGISFTNDDPSKALTESRKKAIADAVARARTLSEAAGVQLGRILEINEQTFVAPPVPIAAKTFDARESVPIEPGMNAYRVQVTVTLELR
ncbi:SIMPL domain-containing protein [Pseudaminobacter sp. 19-2017]|uniref:SIMPL domain-containing protein n=1 Tax=Pseudaminobacter soli (ex Zhang et al. 2022) TaxID=2831468 RepID=A0A942I3A8_9HYPH|nr:SIMPL domain-containing protein [Pseudaminobacter soli]MBS3650987.1 SIMPL domain-containing protein [Pseudaminobacter soli]